MADPRLAPYGFLQGAQISPQNKEEPLYQAVQDSINLFNNKGVEAGLESIAPTAPIAAYLRSEDRKADSPILGFGVGGTTVGDVLAGFVPETRGESLLAAAGAAFGGLRRAGALPQIDFVAHPSGARRMEKLGIPRSEIPKKYNDAYSWGENTAENASSYGPRVAARIPRSTQIKRELQEAAVEAINDMHSIPSHHGGPTTADKLRGAAYNALTDVAGGIRRYFLGQEEQ